MKFSIIYWNSRAGNSTNDILPEELKNAIDIIRVKDYDEVVKILNDHPSIKTVVVCLHPADIETLFHVQSLQKKFSQSAILAIFSSNYHISVTTSSLKMIANSLRNTDTKNVAAHPLSIAGGNAKGINEDSDIPLHLTPRQVEVLALLMRGNSNKQIARTLHLSEGTIKIHCMAIFKELGVSNRTQAAMCAERVMPQIQELWNKLPEERQRKVLA